MKYYVIRNDPDTGQRLVINEEELRFWEGRAILNADGSQYGSWVRSSGPYDDSSDAYRTYWDTEKIKKLHGYV